jgi:hypothetical protein
VALFQANIDATTTAQVQGTPTLGALTGAFAFAKTVATDKASKDGGRVAVVLVTDGDPSGCSSSVDNVSALAATNKDAFPTYVIGVGSQLTSLDKVAAAGGTGKAYIVSTTDPTATSTQLNSALGSIRSANLGCEYALPPTTNGEAFDPAKVNVVRTSTAGAGATLAYDKDCAADGWHYDDPTNPTKIELCASACTALQGDGSAGLDIQVGCVTKGTDGVIPR